MKIMIDVYQNLRLAAEDSKAQNNMQMFMVFIIAAGKIKEQFEGRLR